MRLIPFSELLDRQAAQNGRPREMGFRGGNGDRMPAFLPESLAVERNRISEHKGGTVKHLRKGLRGNGQVVGDTVRSSLRILLVHGGEDFAFSCVQGGTDQPLREGYVLDENVQRRNSGEWFSGHERKRLGRCQGDAEPCEGSRPDGNGVDLDQELVAAHRNAGAFIDQASVLARVSSLIRTAIGQG